VELLDSTIGVCGVRLHTIKSPQGCPVELSACGTFGQHNWCVWCPTPHNNDSTQLHTIKSPQGCPVEISYPYFTDGRPLNKNFFFWVFDYSNY